MLRDEKSPQIKRLCRYRDQLRNQVRSCLGLSAGEIISIPSRRGREILGGSQKYLTPKISKTGRQIFPISNYFQFFQNEIPDGGRQSIIESVLSCVSIRIFIEIGGSVQKLRALECRHHMPLDALSRKMSKSDPPLWGEPLLFEIISTFRNIQMIECSKASNPGRKYPEHLHRGRHRHRPKSKNSIFVTFSNIRPSVIYREKKPIYGALSPGIQALYQCVNRGKIGASVFS